MGSAGKHDQLEESVVYFHCGDRVASAAAAADGTTYARGVFVST